MMQNRYLLLALTSKYTMGPPLFESTLFGTRQVRVIARVVHVVPGLEKSNFMPLLSLDGADLNSGGGTIILFVKARALMRE